MSGAQENGGNVTPEMLRTMERSLKDSVEKAAKRAMKEVNQSMKIHEISPPVGVDQLGQSRACYVW